MSEQPSAENGTHDGQHPHPCGPCSFVQARRDDNAENGTPTIPAMALRPGDRFVVEPGEGDEFEATLTAHYGWGMVHGCIDLAARRDDGEEFAYSIHYQAPVRVLGDDR